MQYAKFTLVLFLLAPVSCTKKSSSSSTTKEWVKPTEANQSVFDRAKAKKPVIIFYANNSFLTDKDNNEDSNYSYLKKLLGDAASGSKGKTTAEEKKNLSRIQANIDYDLETFTKKALDGENDLVENMCGGSADRLYNYIVFTNSMTASLYHYSNLSYCDDTDHFKNNGSLEQIKDFPYDSHPLSYEGNFIKALDIVRATYPSDKYSYILIVVSHGHPDQALTVRMGVDLRKLSAKVGDDAIIATLAKFKTLGADGLDKEDESASMDHLFYENPDNYDNLTLKLVKDHQPNEKPKLAGISKLRFYEILREKGKKDGMDFPLVIAQACNSNPDLINDKNDRKKVADLIGKESNIGFIFSSEKGLKIDGALNYGKIANEGEKSNLYDAFYNYMKTLDGKKADN